MEITHHSNSVRLSVCRLSVGLSVCQSVSKYICLSGLGGVCASLFISLLVLVWLTGYESARLVCYVVLYCLFAFVCQWICHTANKYPHPMAVRLAVCLSPALLAALSALLNAPASAIKRNICSGSSRQPAAGQS